MCTRTGACRVRRCAHVTLCKRNCMLANSEPVCTSSYKSLLPAPTPMHRKPAGCPLLCPGLEAAFFLFADPHLPGGLQAPVRSVISFDHVSYLSLSNQQHARASASAENTVLPYPAPPWFSLHLPPAASPSLEFLRTASMCNLLAACPLKEVRGRGSSPRQVVGSEWGAGAFAKDLGEPAPRGTQPGHIRAALLQAFPD